MRALRSIVRLELLTIVRDRTTWIGLLGVTIATFAVLPVREQMMVVVEPPDLTSPTTDSPATDTTEPLPPVHIDGQLPVGVVWPHPVVSESEATVVIEVVPDPPHKPVLRLHAEDRGDARTIRSELRGAMQRERATWLERNDLRPARTIKTVGRPKSPELTELPEMSTPGTLVGTFAMLFAGAFALEAIPRRRASGLLEQLRCTRTPMLTLVLGWLLSLLFASLAYSLVVGLSLFGASMIWGLDSSWWPLIHAFPNALLVGALSIRTSLKAGDTQAATIRWFAVVGLILITGAASAYLLETPWAAALIPLGGTLLATTGLLGWWALLADAVALATTALVAWWCARLLQNEDDSGADPTLRRHARGNFVPEAITLAAIGVTAAVLPPVLPGPSLVLSMMLAFIGLMAVPALLAPAVLSLPRHVLIPLPRPKLLNLALAIPLTIGAVGLSVPVFSLTTAMLPPSIFVTMLERSMSHLISEPVGVIALGVLPGVCEELLFRGAVLGLLERSGNRRLANVGQALLFGIAHGMAVRLPWTFVFGLVLGWIRQRTDSLWPTIVLHTLFNTTLGLVALSSFDPASLGAWAWVALLPGLLFLPLYGRLQTPPATT